MDSRQLRRRRRRREMLDTAMAIVIDEGLEALTIAHLAERLSAAVGALYRYFPSKEALIVGLQQQALEMYFASLRSDLEQADRMLESPGDATPSAEVAALFRVLVAFAAYLRDATRSPQRHRLLDAMVSAPQPLLTDDEARRVNETLAPILSTCDERLDHAVHVDALRPGLATERTHLMWVALHGLGHFRKRDRIQPPELQVARLELRMLRSLLAGWGATRADLDAAFELLAELRRRQD